MVITPGRGGRGRETCTRKVGNYVLYILYPRTLVLISQVHIANHFN